MSWHAWFGVGGMIVASVGMGGGRADRDVPAVRRWKIGTKRREALYSAMLAATLILGVFAAVTLAYGLIVAMVQIERSSMADDLEQLRGFLADRDAACPCCGCNLRGAATDVVSGVRTA